MKHDDAGPWVADDVMVVVGGRRADSFHGMFAVCVQSPDEMEVYDAGRYRVRDLSNYERHEWNGCGNSPDIEYTYGVEHVSGPRVPSSGIVQMGDGTNGAHLGVQPILLVNPFTGECESSPHMVTTDEQGRFTMDESPLLCGVRIFRGGGSYVVVDPSVSSMVSSYRLTGPWLEQLPGTPKQLIVHPGSGCGTEAEQAALRSRSGD